MAVVSLSVESFKNESEMDIREGDCGRAGLLSGLSPAIPEGELKTRRILSTRFTPVGVMMSCNSEEK